MDAGPGVDDEPRTVAANRQRQERARKTDCRKVLTILQRDDGARPLEIGRVRCCRGVPAQGRDGQKKGGWNDALGRVVRERHEQRTTYRGRNSIATTTCSSGCLPGRQVAYTLAGDTSGPHAMMPLRSG